MSLFDFFFPEQAQASHLRRLADQQQASGRNESPIDQTIETHSFRIFELEKRVTELERDLGFVSLLLATILNTVEKKEVVSREEIHATMEQMDLLDMFKDGRLTISALKEWANRK